MSGASRIDPSTTEVRPGLAFDVGRLADYLRAHVADYRGPLTIRQFEGGQSNPTYALLTPERRYVLRRKPPGALLVSAHAVDREYRVLRALSEHATVPVPRAYTLCMDETVIGTSFYVMEHIDGRVFRDPAFPELPIEARPEYFDAMNAAIASLHRVDPTAAGLTDFGRTNDYLARQIARWSQQYHDGKAAGRAAAMDRLLRWLPQLLPAPEEPAAIVHGDFRVDNLLFHPTEARVLAILDWELSTLGDPLADFAYHLMMYRLPTLSIPGLRGVLQIPSEASYVEAYCRRTGRTGLANLDFYLAFSMFRLAAILHGIRDRVLRGTAVSARAREHAQYVETVAEFAWEQTQTAMGAL